VKITPDPMTIPTTGGGQTIQNINTLKIKFPVPANSTYVSATLSGGSNLGTGTPTVSQASGVITLSVPGNLAPGTSAVLPTISVTLKASGPVASTIKTILAGNSFTNPGITFNTQVQVIFVIQAAVSCFVTPSPVFSTTNIT